MKKSVVNALPEGGDGGHLKNEPRPDPPFVAVRPKAPDEADVAENSGHKNEDQDGQEYRVNIFRRSKNVDVLKTF